MGNLVGRIIENSSNYEEYFSSFVFDQALAADVLAIVLSLAVVSLFIYVFYKSVSKKNLIALNLKKYNTSEHPLTNKVAAILLYTLEYIVIIPFLITLWFTGLAVVLLLIAKERLIGDVLLITAAIIGATRILAYFHSEIAKDLAKLFPFITLSVFLLTPGEFSFEMIYQKLGAVPSLLSHILSFIVVIAVIEIVLRIFFTMYEFWRSEGGTEEAVAEVTAKRS